MLRSASVFFLLIWGGYFLLGYGLAAQTNAFARDCCFGLDQARVLQNLLGDSIVSFHSNVHPFFVLLVRPVVQALAWGIGDAGVAILALQSALGAFSVLLLYAYVQLVCGNRKISICLSALYGVSATQLLYTVMVETYIYAGCTLLLMHYVFLRYGARLSQVALVGLGLLAFAMTITNVMQFSVLLWFYLQGSMRAKCQRFIVVHAWLLLVATLLAWGQQALYPNARPFYTVVEDVAVEARFLAWTPTAKSDAHLTEDETPGFAAGFFQKLWTQSWLITDWKQSQVKKERIMFDDYFGEHLLFGAAMLLVLVVAIGFAWRGTQRRQTIAVLICLLLNLGLHSVYGFYTGYLYTQHFCFLMVFLLAYGMAAMPAEWKRWLGYSLQGLLVFAAYYNAQAFTALSAELFARFAI